MKSLFRAVRQNNLGTVKSILDKNPDLINCVAMAPPKADEGESLLQVATKSHSLEVAHYLIDRGIDVNFVASDQGLPIGKIFTPPVLVYVVMFMLSIATGWRERAEELKKLLLHLLEKGADPNKETNEYRNVWDWAIQTYSDGIYRIKEDDKEDYTALAKEVLEILYQYHADILNIDRVRNELGFHKPYNLVLENLILNRGDFYGVAPKEIDYWNKVWIPVILLMKPFYRRNNPNYENGTDNITEQPQYSYNTTDFSNNKNEVKDSEADPVIKMEDKTQITKTKQPEYPFDMTNYTCFSIINCPAEQAIQLLEEYPSLCAAENRIPFAFQIATVPEGGKWTLLRWPRLGRFYDMMNLTMWLMGYRVGMGGENPIFIALPPEERAMEGPFLARPDYDNLFGDSMLGFWQNWSFEYKIPGEKLRWIGENVFPQEYFFYGKGYLLTGFQLEWLKHLERISDWVECTISMER